MLRSILVTTALATIFAGSGCGSCLGSKDDDAEDESPRRADGSERKSRDDDDEPDDDAKATKKARPRACELAEKCCEEMAEFRGQDAGLVCTGVYAEHSGAKCNEFKRGYAGVFQASDEPLPETCQ